jgi:hypothetical protein
MKKIWVVAFFLLLVAPCFAQNQNRLSSDDQKRFDSYYQRWLDYKRTNNRDEIVSMEKRMQDVMRKYNISSTTPYERIASGGSYGGGYNRYRSVLSRDDQSRFDSYYSRWQNYQRTNNRSEVLSMEKRMQDLMSRNNIPLNVPYGAIATNGDTGWGGNNGGKWNNGNNGWGRGRNQWRGKLSADDQSRFDSYYSRWLDYRRRNDGDQIRSMEGRMRDVMQKYNIPSNVPFDQVASQGR